MNRLLLVGLNHTTAPLAVREKLAFNAQQQRDAVVAFRERFPEAEAVLVSTCNRVELYTARPVHGHPRAEEMFDFLADFHSLPKADFAPHMYTKTNVDVVRHLFAVASSLDSMVLGETQILGQVRVAYECATGVSAAGALLNPLFQRAIAVGKQVMRDTPLSEGRVSVASVAVNYAKQIFEHFGDKTILSIGAGKMSVLALTNFKALSPKRLLVCNRDPVKAKTLADRFAGEAVEFDKLSEHLVAADVVITSTGSSEPIMTASQFHKLLPERRFRPMFLIDIALPRDVEEAVGKLENVYLYNLDDLQQVVSATHEERKGAMEAARKIVHAQVHEYAAWHRARELGPLIDRLYRRSQAIAADEVARTINKLGNINEQERGHLEDLARRIVNKLLHTPVQQLRSTDDQTPGTAYLRAMEHLFGLSREDAEPAAGAGEEAAKSATADPAGPPAPAPEPTEDRRGQQSGS